MREENIFKKAKSDHPIYKSGSLIMGVPKQRPATNDSDEGNREGEGDGSEGLLENQDSNRARTEPDATDG